jgi:hypothetical protein
VCAVGKDEEKRHLGRGWCKRLDGVVVGGVCLCLYFGCLYVSMFVPKDTSAYT